MSAILLRTSSSSDRSPNISKEGEEALVFICIIFAGLMWLIIMLYHCYRESKEPGEQVTVDHPYWHENSMRTPRQPKQSTPSPSPDQVLFPREDVVEHRHQLLHQHRSIPNQPVSQFRINQNCSQQLLATPLHFRVQVPPLHSPSTSTSTHSLIHSPSIAAKTQANQQNAQSLRLLRASETRELSASKKTEHCSICMDRIEPLFHHTTAHLSPIHHFLSTVSARELLENFEFAVETKQCKHIFHERCLKRWLTEGNSDCPLCRSPVQSNEFHRRELIYAIFG